MGKLLNVFLSVLSLYVQLGNFGSVGRAAYSLFSIINGDSMLPFILLLQEARGSVVAIVLVCVLVLVMFYVIFNVLIAVTELSYFGALTSRSRFRFHWI